jgi:hypothetical protein
MSAKYGTILLKFRTPVETVLKSCQVTRNVFRMECFNAM